MWVLHVKSSFLTHSCHQTLLCSLTRLSLTMFSSSLSLLFSYSISSSLLSRLCLFWREFKLNSELSHPSFCQDFPAISPKHREKRMGHISPSAFTRLSLKVRSVDTRKTVKALFLGIANPSQFIPLQLTNILNEGSFSLFLPLSFLT